MPYEPRELAQRANLWDQYALTGIALAALGTFGWVVLILVLITRHL